MSIFATRKACASYSPHNGNSKNILPVLLRQLKKTQNYAIAKATLGQILDHPDGFLARPMSEIVDFFKSPKEYFVLTPNYSGISDMRAELFEEINKRCPENFTARTAAMKIFKDLYDNNGYVFNGKSNSEKYFSSLVFTCIKDMNREEKLKDELKLESIDFPKVLENLVTGGYANLVFTDR